MSQCKYTKTHEWIKTDDTQACTLGITEHAQELLGEMVYVELPTVGDSVKSGDSLAVVESVKAASDVYAPISGTITEVNTQLESNPGLLNTAPLTEGWLIKIKPDDLSELNALLDEADYQKHIEEH